MPDDLDDLIELAEDLETAMGNEHQLDSERRRAFEFALMQFALDALEPVRAELPPEVAGLMHIAEGLSENDVDEAALTEARVAAWRYLGPRSCDFSDRSVVVVRVAMCALVRSWPVGRFYESVRGVIGFATRAGVDAGYLRKALEQRFREARDGGGLPS